MKQYELTIIIHPDLEMNIQPTVDKVKKLVEENGLKITKETNEGKKHLEYQIEGQDYGIFYFFDLEGDSIDANRKISGALNISDDVIRYLLVKADARKAKLEAIRKERDAKRREYREAQEAQKEDSSEEE